MQHKKSLLIIDLQNDFCSGGSLAVPQGEAIVPLANQLQDYFDIIVASADWHPQKHISFASNHPQQQVGDVIEMGDISQVLWPDHCVQQTKGAQFHPQLNTHKIKKIVYKGTDENIDSYSAFFDNAHQRTTGLSAYLRAQQVEDVYLMGLATDYCVKYSVLDALSEGFNAYVIADACRGIELNPGDIAKAYEEMQTAGAKIINSQDITTKN